MEGKYEVRVVVPEGVTQDEARQMADVLAQLAQFPLKLHLGYMVGDQFMSIYWPEFPQPDLLDMAIRDELWDLIEVASCKDIMPWEQED